MRSLLLFVSLLSTFNSVAGQTLSPEAQQEFRLLVQALADSAQVPGGAVVLVQGGRTLFIPLGRPPAGERPISQDTAFRVGSVSKVFTALAVAQLAAEDVLDLDEDIRKERPWLAGVAADQPVTLRQLLTHTSGFDDHAVGMFARTAEDIEPLSEYLRRRMPQRTTEPGRWARYSNHGVALAGEIAAGTAEGSFASVVRNSVFSLLGMESSSFEQPLPRSLRDRMAPAYRCADGTCSPLPFDYRNTTPAGAMVTTPGDMGRFISAFLRADPALPSETWRLMRTASWNAAQGAAGLTLALHQQRIAGGMALVHAGSSSGYKSLLVLLPELKAGIFAVTTGGSGQFGYDLLDAFEARVGASAPQTDLVPLDTDQQEAFPGTYLLGRSARATYESFPGLFLFSDELHLTDRGLLARREGGTWRNYGRLGPDVVIRADGQASIYFERRQDGSVLGMSAPDPFFGLEFPASYERLPRWREPSMVNELFSWAAALPPIALIAWLVAVFGTRLRQRVQGRQRVGPRHAWLAMTVAVATSGATIAFVFGFAAKFNALARTSPLELAFGLPEAISAFLWLSWAVAVGAVLLSGVTALAWVQRGKYRTLDALVLSVVTLCTVLSVALMIHFNMLPPTG